MTTTTDRPATKDTYAVDLDALLAAATAWADDEVVAHALCRDVALPFGAGTAVLITLDNGRDHTRPNTFGPRSLAELNVALDAALARSDVAAVAITGKPFVFAAGADLSGIGKLTEREQARMIAQIGHGVFNRLHEAPVPTFTFYNGLALGGGLEIGLHCDYRTVSAAAAALGLPECFLGMLPGWGGNYLLPNLIGPDAAVTVMIENPLNSNRTLTGPDARRLGIADALFDGADFLERSLEWAAGVIIGRETVTRPAPDRGEAWDAAVAHGRAVADAKTSGASPGPYRALELLAAAKTSTRAEGFTAEDEALADLLMSDELRAGLYAFDLVQKRAKRPAGAPSGELARSVTSVGVVGAGLMASQLALLFARRLQVPVVMSDVDQGRVDRGLGYVQDQVERLAGKRRISSDAAARLRELVTGTTALDDFADCDFVIEAVFEEIGVKKAVFADLEARVRPDCVLATNTSSLSVTEMAADLAHPERVVGFHFFNPIAVLPLVEVVRAAATDDATVATALAVAKDLRKNPVLVADAPAFVVNRLLLRLMGEVLGAVDEGTPVPVADAALRPLGLPMPPFLLAQLVGLPVVLHVAETLHAAFPDRFGVSENLRRLVAAKKPGIYDWTPDGEPYVSEETANLLLQGDRPSTAEEVRQRAVDAVAQEVGRMLADGVVAAPMDIDLCMILGAGWPFHLGGITPYLDRSGASERVLGQRLLPGGVASVA